jgi:hypothetical protein
MGHTVTKKLSVSARTAFFVRRFSRVCKLKSLAFLSVTHFVNLVMKVLPLTLLGIAAMFTLNPDTPELATVLA